MKNAICLLLFCLLLQGCFGYKNFDTKNKSYVSGQYYKIKQDKKFEKVKFLKSDSANLMVLRHGKEKIIPIADVKAVKVRKFSVVKTALIYPALIAAGTVFIFTGLSL
ncbi:MAG: hypothetical protein PSV16_15860 [Flavobacterium sp.]|nr:hypothetical protein [Flavobacterium sp.]